MSVLSCGELIYCAFLLCSGLQNAICFPLPGLDEPKVNKILGPSTLELSQGDVLAGIISRADLAELAVELVLSKDSNLRNTALEAYYTKGATPCDKPFKDFLDNGAVARLHGDTYKDLFSGIKPGLDYYEV